MSYWIAMPSRKQDSDGYIDNVPNEIYSKSIRFDTGKAIHAIFDRPTLLLGATPYKKIRDVLESGGANGIVANGKVKSAFDDLDIKNIQFFEAVVKDDKSSKMYHNWYLCNVVGVVDCIDYRKSKLELLDDGGIEFIDSLSLDEEKIIKSELEIFRLYGYLGLIVVSERIKSGLENNKIEGFEYILPSELML